MRSIGTYEGLAGALGGTFPWFRNSIPTSCPSLLKSRTKPGPPSSGSTCSDCTTVSRSSGGTNRRYEMPSSFEGLYHAGTFTRAYCRICSRALGSPNYGRADSPNGQAAFGSGASVDGNFVMKD